MNVLMFCILTITLLVWNIWETRAGRSNLIAPVVFHPNMWEHDWIGGEDIYKLSCNITLHRKVPTLIIFYHQTPLHNAFIYFFSTIKFTLSAPLWRSRYRSGCSWEPSQPCLGSRWLGTWRARCPSPRHQRYQPRRHPRPPRWWERDRQW